MIVRDNAYVRDVLIGEDDSVLYFEHKRLAFEEKLREEGKARPTETIEYRPLTGKKKT